MLTAFLRRKKVKVCKISHPSIKNMIPLKTVKVLVAVTPNVLAAVLW